VCCTANCSEIRGQLSALEVCKELPHQAQRQAKVLWTNTCGREVEVQVADIVANPGGAEGEGVDSSLARTDHEIFGA